jgi:hypothetical protein
LIDEEFLAASSSIQFAAQMNRWGDVLIFKPTTLSWEKYHTVLAMELSTSVWATVLNADLAVKQLIDLRAIGTDPSDPGKLPNGVLELAETFRGEIEQGRAALAAFSASEPS